VNSALKEATKRYHRQAIHVGTVQDRLKEAFVAGAQWAEREDYFRRVEADDKEYDNDNDYYDDEDDDMW
jgi:hypothetical protein